MTTSNQEPELSPGINHQTGTSYTIAHSDREKLVTFANASPVAVTVPKAVASFGAGFRFQTLNLGAGTITFTPTVSTVNGAATLELKQGESAEFSSDGTNWSAEQLVAGPAGAKGDTGATGPAGPAGAAGAGFLYQSIKQNSIAGSVTTLTTLVSFDAFSAGLLNVIGRRLVIKGKGFFTTAIGETPTIRFDVYMAAASRASITSGTVLAGLTNSPFKYEFVFQTSVIGASGRLITTATMLMSLDGTTYTNYMSIPDTDTTAFDLTGVFGPAVTVTCGGTALTLVDVRSSYAQVS